MYHIVQFFLPGMRAVSCDCFVINLLFKVCGPKLFRDVLRASSCRLPTDGWKEEAAILSFLER